MNQIDTKIEYIPFKGWITTYYFKYKFIGLDYLVADKYGNFFVLNHCKRKRSTSFKKLNSSKGYIYYNQIKYYLSRLRNKSIINYTNIKIK